MPQTVKGRQPAPPVVVHVVWGEGVYTAVCDDLCLVTEAATLDQLKDYVWELAPELIELNGLDVDPDTLRLHFEIERPIEHRVAM